MIESCAAKKTDVYRYFSVWCIQSVSKILEELEGFDNFHNCPLKIKNWQNISHPAFPIDQCVVVFARVLSKNVKFFFGTLL